MAVDPSANPPRTGVARRPWPWIIAAGGLACLVTALAFWWFIHSTSNQKEKPSKPATLTFDGDSGQLEQTVIVPTLNTPFPQKKSAVWCASFQIAWNQFKTDVVKGPIRLRNAGTVANHLNGAPQSKADLVPGSYYAAAGWVKDGIIRRIQQDMAEKFPNVAQPQFDELANNPLTEKAAVAYAYLQALVKFKHKFSDNDDPFSFEDSSGKRSPVRSFGILENEKDTGNSTFREQVTILYRSDSEFALDLCKYSDPNQIVLARIQRSKSLAATLEALQAKMKRPPAKPGQGLSGNAILLVPSMHWRIGHHFKELKGQDKQFLNAEIRGYFVAIAFQRMEFDMHRSGVKVEAEGVLGADWNGDTPEKFCFDKPFLIYMKKRGANQPFFVMWVDNAELMHR